jgi:hypothetical protein
MKANEMDQKHKEAIQLMDSVKQYLGSESVYGPTTHNFYDVFAVLLFAGHWELGFRRWLKSRLDKAMEAKTKVLTNKVSKEVTKISKTYMYSVE